MASLRARGSVASMLAAIRAAKAVLAGCERKLEPFHLQARDARVQSRALSFVMETVPNTPTGSLQLITPGIHIATFRLHPEGPKASIGFPVYFEGTHKHNGPTAAGSGVGKAGTGK